MQLTKQNLNIPFALGVDTKTDPYQVTPGRFLSLTNSVFTVKNRLTKRNGFDPLASLPNSSCTYLSTFNGDLTAIGKSLFAYSRSKSWFNKGAIQPIKLSTLPLIRSNLNQTQADSVVSANGLVCTAYTDNPAGGATIKYVIADAVTGQNIIAPTSIPVSSGTPTGSPRVFLLGNYFVIVFTNLITAVSHLQYIAISTANPTAVTANADIASAYIPKTTLSWDGFVANQNLYIAYNTTTGGQSIKVTYLAASLGSPVTAVTYAGQIATMVSVTADQTTTQSPIIYVSYYDAAGSTGHTLAVDKNLNPILAPTQTISSGTYLNIASSAINGSCNIIVEDNNSYTYDSAIPNHQLYSISVTQAGTVVGPALSIRGVGLASKAFLVDGQQYFLGVYQSPYQPTYFLMNSNTNAIGKLAYQNGGGYLTLGLPSATVHDSTVFIAYLFKDLIQSVNKNTNVPSGSQTAGIYSQTGINLVKFTFDNPAISTGEIGSNLNISGGILWAYDGYLPVEQNFHLWPDSVEATWSATGGSIVAKPDGSTNTNAYFYRATYEWTDSQGNAFKSAPSIPVAVTTSGAGSSGSITVYVPYLTLTYKVANPVKIVIYRWSVAQQSYYQVTSISSPSLNNNFGGYLTFVDTLADASILGNNLLYTTGGVLENIGPPATNLITLFDSRLWLVDAEDPNLLWFSKQVIEGTPVEMSDLLTLYIPPTIGSQGSTGPIASIAAMDDKLILGKQNAFYYMSGSGPDNTGANSQYSQPIFITSTVGCANQQSLVMTPNGLMFQSDKGIWILGRDLSTNYIGADVEAYTTDATVQSAVNVPGTTQIRFTLDSGITLMYDYYYNQWGTFSGIPAISSTIYQGLHTYLNSSGVVSQETPGEYLDNGNPVLMSFKTGWISLAGIQGLERFYYMLMLGRYITPFKLNVQFAYDFSPAPQDSRIVTPGVYGPMYGEDSSFGSSELFAGPSDAFKNRIFPTKQKVESFQIIVNELYDSSQGVVAGAGLTLSGMNLVVGMKKGFRVSAANRSFG